MKLSKVFHVLSIIAGFLGIIALLGAWYASKNSSAFGMSEAHLFNDAMVLILIAIWIQLATIHHMKLEEKGERI
jgi:hypothetical protein